MRIANKRGTTNKKRCEGTIGDSKSLDRLEVRSSAVKEVKGTHENREVIKNKSGTKRSKLVPG